MTRGLIIINTGNGKGKSTAAFGAMLRACGQGLKVCIIQFIKGTWKYGEMEAVKRFSDLVDFFVIGKGFIYNAENAEEHKKAAREAWGKADSVISSGAYDMVILDELTYIINYDFVNIEEIFNVLKNRKPSMHIVITGRKAHPKLIEYADLVTEMVEIKHPFKNGVNAQRGVEF